MKAGILVSLGGIALCGLIGLGAAASRSPVVSPANTISMTSNPAVTTALAGDYVEARTCSVFAGACHYNGEYMSGGRDAILAFNITAGAVNGIDLTGVKAMAVVSSPDNLADTSFPHHSEVLIDNNATESQVSALVAELHTKWASSLGDITTVRRGSVSFTRDAGNFTVSAAGFGTIKISAMPNNECCKQPNDVWYTPLIPLSGRRVGYTESASYVGGTMGDRWDRSAENGAFYGSLAE
jgi:hypothetical protein